MKTADIQAREMTRGERWMVWTGRIVSLLPVLIVLMSSRWKLTESPFYVREWGRIGWQVKDLPFIALAPTRRNPFVCDPAYVGSRNDSSYGLPWRRDRLLRSNWGTVSPAAPAHNSDARLAGDLPAR